tara:strand:- start:314 stop:520 length:207 start_codon:yes stop_codon:yes gene_type:complete
MKKLDFNSSQENSNIEIVLQVRDKNGNPTGRTKAFSSDNARGVSDFYNKQKVTKSKKRRRNRGGSNGK